MQVKYQLSIEWGFRNCVSTVPPVSDADDMENADLDYCHKMCIISLKFVSLRTDWW